MVQLVEADIQTKEVLDWQGVHLFHFQGSTCSQKTRIFLRLKGIEWQSHHLNLVRKQHHTPFYMGINPRGLVPTLVHDGRVIIESNDILEYLESAFPEPALIPRDEAQQVHEMLQAEDDLHMDIRALTMRFMFPSFLTRRPASDLKTYAELGSGTVGGTADPHKQAELDFWQGLLEHGQVTDAQARQAFARFRTQLDQFDETLSGQDYLLGKAVGLVDIAWYIYVRRLIASSYPLARLHAHVWRWFSDLDARPEFHDEVPSGGLLGMITKSLHLAQRLRGRSLESVVAS